MQLCCPHARCLVEAKLFSLGYCAIGRLLPLTSRSSVSSCCWCPMTGYVTVVGTRLGICRWNDQIGVVREFQYFITVMHRTQVGCSGQVCCRSYCRALDDAGEDVCHLGYASGVLREVRMSTEKVCYPVIDLIRYRKSRHLWPSAFPSLPEGLPFSYTTRDGIKDPVSQSFRRFIG